MKAKYKFIHFIESKDGELTAENKIGYECRNNKTGKVLAYIFYYELWKGYCFTQADAQIIFNDKCLVDIIDFLKQLKED